MHEPPDLAHIAHAELLTPFPDESLRFFVELFGMQIEHREGQSVFLRGWGEYQPYGLKLTEAQLPGLGHVASAPGTPRRSSAGSSGIEATGLGERVDRGRPRPRARLPVPRPRRAPLRAVLRAGSLRPARGAAPAPEERAPAPRRPRRRGQAASTTSTSWPPTSPPTGASPRSSSATALYEQVILDSGEESGAWMSLSIAAHELIYTADHAGGQRPPAPPRLVRRHPRGVPARRRPVRGRRRADRGGAVQARGGPGDVPLRLRAGRQPRRGDDRHPLHL